MHDVESIRTQYSTRKDSKTYSIVLRLVDIVIANPYTLSVNTFFRKIYDLSPTVLRVYKIIFFNCPKLNC